MFQKLQIFQLTLFRKCMGACFVKFSLLDWLDRISNAMTRFGIEVTKNVCKHINFLLYPKLRGDRNAWFLKWYMHKVIPEVRRY